MFEISNIQRKHITVDQAERTSEISLLCSVIPLSNSSLMKKEFNLQEGWSGNFLCIVSVISADAVLPLLLAKRQDIQFLSVSEGSKEGPEYSQCK